MGSNVMTDRTTLMKIASTPYANHRHGWKLEAIRIGNTLIVCPRAIEGEQRHFTEGGGLKGVYRLEMLKSILTQVSTYLTRLLANYLILCILEQGRRRAEDLHREMLPPRHDR